MLPTSSHSQHGLSDFSHLVGTRPSDEHLRQSFGNLRFIATVAVKGLRVELTFSISGNVEIFDAAS